MRIEGTSGLALLQDLAILYLGLAKGADDDLDPAETKEVAARLRRWQPDKDPALIDHVIRDVTLSYEEEASTEEVHAAVDSLGEKLSESLRVKILDDLSDIARADGLVLKEEKNFVEHIASSWGVSSEHGLESPTA
jgi:uncharacterized tellurite resistance protein B-like protein